MNSDSLKINPFERILCLYAGLLISIALPAQERMQIHRLEQEIEFDGRPDEAAWQGIDTLPMIQHIPTFGLSPGERSEVRIAYDDNYLYIAGRLLVSDPSYVRAIGKKRDMESENCDWFGVLLDTYNDKENALLFFTNPNGLRWDATVSNDATFSHETMPMNINWNTFWDVKTEIDHRGWYTEMRIPVSSLRFQERDGKVVMGLSVFRWIPALNEGIVFPAIPYNWGPTSNLKPSQYAEVEFTDLAPRKAIYISPYLLAGYEQTHALNTAETSYEYSKAFPFEPGLDLKYGINPNTILDLTLNTDFAQVEADDQQFNLSRFSLVFPEKRMFFLERSSIFDFGLGGPNNLFYSRKIGLHEGEPVRILGGARLTSRVGEWDLGVLDLQTAAHKDLLPSENFGVFRAKRKVMNPYSYTGGMLTSRLGADGSYNIAYGIDAVLNLFRDDYLTIRWSQSFEDSLTNNPFSLEQSRFLVSWENRRQEGFSYAVRGTYGGPEYEAGIGLEVFENYFFSNEELRYTWISPEESPLQSHYLFLNHLHLNDAEDATLLIYEVGPGWFFSAKKGWNGLIRLNYNYEHLQEDFELLDPVIVPTGSYRFANSMIMLNTPGSRALSASFTFDGGGYYDGLRISPSIEPRWSLGASVELGGLYRFDFVDFPDRSQTLRNHIAGLRALYMLNTKLSFSAFIQYNSAIHKVLSNFRFRYNPREGTDLYIVFNEGRNTDLYREAPVLPVYDQRNFTIKYTHTFALGSR